MDPVLSHSLAVLAGGGGALLVALAAWVRARSRQDVTRTAADTRAKDADTTGKLRTLAAEHDLIERLMLRVDVLERRDEDWRKHAVALTEQARALAESYDRAQREVARLRGELELARRAGEETSRKLAGAERQLAEMRQHIAAQETEIDRLRALVSAPTS